MIYSMPSTYQNELLTNSWDRCWNDVFYSNNQLRDIIIWMYSDPRRHYHNVNHLIGCISTFRIPKIVQLAKNPQMLELGLWVHDLVYDVDSSTNEADSVKLFLSLADIDDRWFNVLNDYVLATTHSTLYNNDTDYDLIADIDLITLSAETRIFDAYCKKIRQEYIATSDKIYYTERYKFLVNLHSRGFIFRTEYFKNEYEDLALTNIYNEICRLYNYLSDL